MKWLLYNENSFISPSLNSLMKKSACFAVQEKQSIGVADVGDVMIANDHFEWRNVAGKPDLFCTIATCSIVVRTGG